MGSSIVDCVQKRSTTVGETDPAEIWTFSDMPSLAAALGVYIRKAAEDSIQKHGSFSLAISGGSLVKALSKVGDVAGGPAPEWSRWHIFWADERVVPLDHADSNYAAALPTFLSQIPVPKDQVHAITETLDAAAAASQYQEKMKKLTAHGTLQKAEGSDFPQLDLILLGVGPDGHIASLFPEHPLLEEGTSWVAPVFDSPKPPPQRITLTLPLINAAARVGVVTTGASKAEILKRVFGKREAPGALPAQQVVGEGRELIWFMDDAAAGSLLS